MSRAGFRIPNKFVIPKQGDLLFGFCSLGDDKEKIRSSHKQWLQGVCDLKHPAPFHHSAGRQKSGGPRRIADLSPQPRPDSLQRHVH